MRGSNAPVAKKLNGKNALFVVANHIGNFNNTASCAWIAAISGILEKEHGQSLVYQKTSRGCSEWLQMMSAGKRFDQVRELYALLCDQRVLQRLGILYADHAGALPLPFHEAELMTFSSEAIELWRRILHSEVMLLRIYKEWLPGVFAALLSTDNAESNVAMAFCSRSWEMFEALEKKAIENEFVWLVPHLRRLIWPECSWCLEVLVALRETGFTTVPADIRTEIHGMTQKHSTHVNENMFNFMRQVRRNLGGKLSPGEQFARIRLSDVLEDFGHKQPIVTPEAREMDPIPVSSYVAQKHDFSMGAATLDKILLDGPDAAYRTNPERHLETPFCHHILLGSFHDPENIAKTWRSNLVVAGTVIQRCQLGVGVGPLYYVIGGCRDAVQLTECTLRARSVFSEWFVLSPPSWDTAIMEYITDENDWCAFSVEEMPPEKTEHVMVETGGKGFGLRKRSEVGQQTLLQCCAGLAMPGWTVPDLEKLLRESLGWKERMPARKYDLTWAILQKVFPGKNYEELKTIMSLQDFKKVPAWAGAITPRERQPCRRGLQRGSG